MTVQILKSCRPNGHYVALKSATNDYLPLSEQETWYVVSTTLATLDDYDSESEDEYDTLAEAEAAYEEARQDLARLPNWAAQAAYDDEQRRYGRDY